MAKSFLTDIQLNGNVLLNAKVQAWGSTPTGTTNPNGSGTAVTGQISTYLGALYIFNGTAWVQVGNPLSDSTSTTSSTTGASSTAVKAAYDLAAAALPKSGGTMSGNIAMGGGNISGGGTFTATSFVGALTGNASTATTAANLSTTYGSSTQVLVQSGTNTTTLLATGTLGQAIIQTPSGPAFGTPQLSTLTFGTGLTAGGASYNGSTAVTITPVSASTSVAGIVQLSDSTSTTSSVLAATATAAKAAYDRGSTGVTDAATAQTTANAALPKAGGTMSGAIAMGNNKITGLGTPTADADAVTKLYVDTIATGLHVHPSVNYATTGALGTTGNLVGGTITTTYANGTSGEGATLTIATSSNWTAITIDGQSLTVTDRVLIKNQVAGLQNGIYTVTQVGAVGNTTSFIFTRATDNDQAPEIDAGDLTYVVAGTVNGGDGYVQTTANVVVGTTAVAWTQFSGAGAVPIATTSSAGIASFPSAQFSVDAGGAVTIGTLNTSVLNAGQLSGARGGTGVDNGSKTITVSGNTTIGSSTHTVALATSGNTSVTLPTSGTLVNSAVTTLSSLASVGTITTGVWEATDIAVAHGGTGASTAAGARSNLGATTKVTGTGSGSGTSIAVAHGLGVAVISQLLDNTGAVVEVDVVTTSTASGTTTFTFASSQTLSNFTYVIIG